MTRSLLTRTVAFFLALPVILSACTEDSGLDYCKNHYRFHHQHQEGLANLRIELDTDGLLSSELDLPVSALGLDTSGLLSVLEDPDQVYTIQSLQSCEPPEVSFGNTTGPMGTRLVVNYTSQCGNQNQVKQVDVQLFNIIPELDEVETNVFTPATTKRFAISRQCNSAIFRLDHGKTEE